MIKITVDKSILEEAKANVKKYNSFNLFGGAYAQKLAGEVGRLCLRQFLINNQYQFKEDTHIGSKDEFDFIIENKNVSLKTQLINFPPKQEWRCEVFIGQIENPCDYHLFLKTHLKDNVSYICGCISKSEFDNISVLRTAGELLDDNFTPWNVKETKRDVMISQLHDISILKT